MKALPLLILLGFLSLVPGCRTLPDASEGRIPVVVSVPPQADLVRRIGGDRVTVEALVRPGSSDEDLSLSPRQMATLERARLYVKVGHPSFGIESRYIDPFLAEHPEVRGVDMSRGMEGLELAPEEGHEGHGHGGGDPHVWTAPGMVSVAARNIAAALEEADPAHAAEYRDNLARLLVAIGRLDREIRSRLAAPGAEHTFLVYHPSWGYFARQYGLEQIAIEAEGKEPGAARLIEVIDRARREGSRLLVVPEAIPRESAFVIADAIDGRIVSADPLSPDWERTLRRMAEALGGGPNG